MLLAGQVSAKRDRSPNWGEFPEPLRPNFMRMDANRDGFIDLVAAREIDARRDGTAASAKAPGLLVRVVRRMDTDGDGQLQKREAPLRLQNMFERFDSSQKNLDLGA